MIRMVGQLIWVLCEDLTMTTNNIVRNLNSIVDDVGYYSY